MYIHFSVGHVSNSLTELSQRELWGNKATLSLTWERQSNLSCLEGTILHPHQQCVQFLCVLVNATHLFLNNHSCTAEALWYYGSDLHYSMTDGAQLLSMCLLDICFLLCVSFVKSLLFSSMFALQRFPGIT